MTAVVVGDAAWKPVKRGAFYGSAQCCHASLCTLVAFDQASIEARLLCDRLGLGWEPRVWENLGWHYQAVLASGESAIYVSPHTSGSHIRGGWKVSGYFASFNYQWSQDAKTPEDAVIGVVMAIRAEMDRLGAVLATATALALPAKALGETA